MSWVAGRFPGLDSAGCNAFEINNVSFVSLNSVTLPCGNNDLRFSVEKVIERESLDLRTETERLEDGVVMGESSEGFRWRENGISSGSGPVLLLHFPLRQMPFTNLGKSSTMVDGDHGRWVLHFFHFFCKLNTTLLIMFFSLFIVSFSGINI